MSDENKQEKPEEIKTEETAEKKEEPTGENRKAEETSAGEKDESGEKTSKKGKKGKKKDRDKEKPLEKPKEKETKVEEKPAPKVEPSAEEESMGTGSLGFIVIAALLMIMVYFIWFSKPAKPPETAGTPGATTPAPTAVQEDNKLKVAMQNVKESRGPKTQMKLLDRINSYKEMKEKKSKAKIEVMDWTVKPAQGKAEAFRYYDVSFQWNENGAPVVFAWQIDLESNNVVAMNKAAKDLDSYDDILWKELSEAPSPTPAPSPTVVAVVSPTPEPTEVPSPGPTLTPVATPEPNATPAQSPTPKPTDGSIEILPPVTPTPAPTKTTAPPDLPKIDFGDDFYQLTGIMTLGGKKTAMLKYQNKTYSGTAGTKLPDGWTISSITSSSAVLRKGTQTRAIMLKEAIGAPKVPSYDNKSYPKAEKKTPSPSPTDALETPAPDKTPSGEPTIIPID